MALFDVLGFKSIVARHSLKELRAVLENRGRVSQIVNAATLAGGLQHEVSKFKPAPCESIQFSDTILLISPDSTERGLVSILTSSLGLVGASMCQGVPLRGAITRGPIFVSADRRLHAGSAIVRAYHLEQQQEWAGAIVDPEAISLERPRYMTTEVTRDLATIRFAAPMRTGQVVSDCLNWPPFYAMTSLQPIEGLMAFFSGTPDEAAARKISNTVKFAEHAISTWLAEKGRLFPPP